MTSTRIPSNQNDELTQELSDIKKRIALLGKTKDEEESCTLLSSIIQSAKNIESEKPQETPSQEESKKYIGILNLTHELLGNARSIFKSVFARETPPVNDASNPMLHDPAKVSLPQNAAPTKPFEGKLKWGEIEYNVTQNLPQGTSNEDWKTIVDAYEKILNSPEVSVQCKPGIKTLELTLDAKNSAMNIMIPAAVPQTFSITNQFVKNLMEYHAKRNIVGLQSSSQVTREEKTATDLRKITTRDPTGTETIESNKEKRTGIHAAIHGIPNPNNTCFIASSIQAWLVYQKKGLEKKLATATSKDKKIIASILDWIKTYELTAGQGLVEIQPFLENVVAKCDTNDRFEDFGKLVNEWKKDKKGTFPGISQNDANELILWLSTFIESEEIFTHPEYQFALPPGETLIPDANRRDDRYEGFKHLTFEYHNTSGSFVFNKGQTIAQSLERSFEDTLEKGTLIDDCIVQIGTKVERKQLPLESKKDRLSQAPQELTLFIKRFTNTREYIGGSIGKVTEILEMPADYFVDKTQAKYRLRSVISHLGNSLESGHYNAYVRKFDAQGNSQFYLANDSTIAPVTTDKALEAAEEAYMLIYDKIN